MTQMGTVMVPLILTVSARHRCRRATIIPLVSPNPAMREKADVAPAYVFFGRNPPRR
jgi:hypothetical protein